MADNNPTAGRGRGRPPRTMGRGRGRGRNTTGRGGGPERTRESPGRDPSASSQVTQRTTRSQQTHRSNKSSTNSLAKTDSPTKQSEPNTPSHKSDIAEHESKKKDPSPTKQPPKIVTVLNDDDTSEKDSKFSFRFRDDKSTQDKSSNNSHSNLRDISRSRPNQSTTKKSNESTRTNNPGRGNNNRTGGFGRGGKEPHKPITVDTINEPREDPTDPNYKIRHLFYYFNIPWNKETEVIFREIGIDDDYKLIDFMGWSVIDMYTILIGTDSLKFSEKSSFEIRDMIVKLISNLKLIRQYFINVYQFKLDDQGNFESTIGLETITKFSRPTKMELDTFKDEHKNVHHLIEGMILDHEVFLNKSRITKSIAEFKNNVSTNHDKLQSVAIKRDRFLPNKPTKSIDNVKQSNNVDNDYISNYFTDTKNSPRNNTDTVQNHYMYHDPKTRDTYDWYKKQNKNDPIHDGMAIQGVPIPGTNDPNIPPLENEYRDKFWVLRGLQASQAQQPTKRTKLPDTVTWNGYDRTFNKYEDNIVSWALQIGMGYLMRPDFLEAYRKYQWPGAQYHARHITTGQFLQDNEVLFGALMSSAKQRGARYIKDQKQTRDGLTVWIKFKDIFGGDNNLPLKIQRLLDELDVPWSPNYEGGFLAYIDNIVHIYNQLDIEDPTYQLHQESTDKIKCTTIRNRFSRTEYSDTTYTYYDDMEQTNKFDVELYIKRLTKYHQHKEQISYNNARAKANLVTSMGQDNIIPVNVEPTSTNNNVYLANQQEHNKPNYDSMGYKFLGLTNEQYKKLAQTDKELVDNFRETRYKMLSILEPNRPRNPYNAERYQTNRQHNTSNDHKPSSGTPPITNPNSNNANVKDIPNQFSNINLTNTIHDNDDDMIINTLGTDDDSIGTMTSQDQHRLAQAMLVSQEPQDTRHVLFTRTVAISNQIRKILYMHNFNSSFTIVDSGADSVVVGTGWKFLKFYPHRTVDLQGFSESETKKYNCKIGTACTVMKDSNGIEYLVIANEAIQNRKSDISLLSEIQLRHNGIIVDSVSEKHQGLDGPGTQSIYSSDQTIQFKMQQRAAMMTLLHRLPTEEDIKTLPRFELTSDTIWNPCNQNDDPDTINAIEDPFMNINLVTSKNDDSSITSEDLPEQVPHEFELPDDFHIPDRIPPMIELPPVLTQTITPNNEQPEISSPNNKEVDNSDKPIELPHYRPAARILEQMKEPTDLLNGSKQYISINEQDIHEDDKTLYNDLKRTLGNPFSSECYAYHLERNQYSSLKPQVHSHEISAFHTSVHNERIVTDSKNWDDTFYDSVEDHDTLPIADQQLDNKDQFHSARQNPKPSDKLSRAFHLRIDQTNFIRENEVDTFLSELSDKELFGYNEPFDSLSYHTDPVIRQSQISYMLTTSNRQDAEKVQPYLGFRPLEVIRHTLEQTTQLATLATGLPMRRHIQSLFPFLNRKRINETVATDTFFSSTRDVCGATCAQIFYGLRSHFMNIYSLKSETDGPSAFEDFARYEGLPNVIRSDNSKMQRYNTKLLEKLRSWLVSPEFTEPHHPQQNPAELRAIRWIKRNIQVLRIRTGAPETVWFWMAKYLVDIHNITADETLGWATPWSKRRGETPDISAFLQFRFYERVYYHDPSQKFPGTKEKTGYWLGIADNVGDRFCYHILTTDTHRVIERSVVRSAEKLTNRTLHFPSDDFEPEDPVGNSNHFVSHEYDEGRDPTTFQDDNSDSDQTERPRRTRLNPNRPRPQGEYRPHVLRRRLRNDKRIINLSRIIGIETIISHNLPDIVEHPDAQEVEIKTPNYAKHLRGIDRFRLDQLRYVISLDLLQDSHDEDAEIWNPLFIYEHRIRKKHGKLKFQFKVGWQYHDPSWIDAYALQLQCPYLITNYARRRHLTKHKHFAWVQYIDPDQETYFAKIFNVSRKEGPKYKFGQLVPRSVAHALHIDKLNGNNEWRDAILTELKQINDYKTFRLLQQDEYLNDFKCIPYHIVFDVKFDLRKKARLVAGGHKTDPPKEDLYSGVVDLMTIRLCFILAYMNGLICCAGDIGNAFLYGKTREKVYIIAGKEFGPLSGTPMIIDRGLYGLKTSSARFHEHLSAKLRSMGYRPSKADSDLWIIQKGEGDNKWYEYIATYVDDVLVFSKDPMVIIRELQTDYILKGIGVPRYYLGGDILKLGEEWTSSNNSIETALSAETYIDNVIEKYEREFKVPFTVYRAPMNHLYHSEEDTTKELDAKQSSVYRGLIGSANWVVTLGRFDIAYAVNNLARYCMAPRQGHFEAALHIFGYLKGKPKGRLLIDKQPYLQENTSFIEYDWNEFYPDAEEELPPDMPTPIGTKLTTVCYVDADHAHDTLTRRSVTGILLFVAGMPVKWYSKRQKTVETSSYGSELVATRIAIELVQELRYKLRMLGANIEDSTIMYGDNMSVVLNTTVPSSQLKKKHNAIAYHRIREAIAARIIQFAHIPSTSNIADLLTKPLPVDTFERLITPVLFRKPTGVITHPPDALLYSHELKHHDDPNNIIVETVQNTDSIYENNTLPIHSNDPERKELLLICDDPERHNTPVCTNSNIQACQSSRNMSVDEQATFEFLEFLNTPQ